MATYKIIEVIGSSPRGPKEAVEMALESAVKTVRKIKGIV